MCRVSPQRATEGVGKVKGVVGESQKVTATPHPPFHSLTAPLLPGGVFPDRAGGSLEEEEEEEEKGSRRSGSLMESGAAKAK